MARPTLPGAALALLLAAPALAQEANPYDGDPAALRAGSALYANRCAECHGADAKGFSGPDLTLLWELGTDDTYVFETVRRGVEGSIMPSSDAPDPEVWAMVAYVKSLSTVPADAYEIGDPERGGELFAASCSRCHRVAGLGGRLGPDLTRVTVTRSREVLVRSVRDPGASVARGYRPVALVTVDGRRIRGVAKSEDAFSIQLMETDERLQGYRKADLAELHREEGSLMPTYTSDRLDDRALEDVLSYLASARASRTARR